MEQPDNIVNKNSDNNPELPKNNSSAPFRSKKFIFLVVLIGIIGFLSISLILLTNSKKTKQNAPISKVSPTANQLQPLNKEFISNAIAVVAAITDGERLMLVDPYRSSSKQVVLTVGRCESIDSIRWSPDKSKIAYSIIKSRVTKRWEKDSIVGYDATKPLKKDETFCDANTNNNGFEFGYISLENRKLTKVHEGWDKVLEKNSILEDLGPYTWTEDSANLYYSVSNKTYKFNLDSNSKKSIKIESLGDPYFTIGNELYGLDLDYIGKLDVEDPDKVIKIVEENPRLDPGWSPGVGTGIGITNYSISPDGEKIIYEFNESRGRSIILFNVRSKTKKKVISFCKESTSYYSFIIDFSRDSSNFILKDYCSKDLNILLFNSNGNLIKTFHAKDTKKLLTLQEGNNSGYTEKGYSMEFSSFSSDSKKILLIAEKWESDNKIKPKWIFTQYAFIADIENGDIKVANGFPNLEGQDEILRIKWSN